MLLIPPKGTAYEFHGHSGHARRIHNELFLIAPVATGGTLIELSAPAALAYAG